MYGHLSAFEFMPCSEWCKLLEFSVNEIKCRQFRHKPKYIDTFGTSHEMKAPPPSSMAPCPTSQLSRWPLTSTTWNMYNTKPCDEKACHQKWWESLLSEVMRKSVISSDEKACHHKFVGLFVLRFYGPVNSQGHVEPVSYPLTLFLGRLRPTKRLTST